MSEEWAARTKWADRLAMAEAGVTGERLDAELSVSVSDTCSHCCAALPLDGGTKHGKGRYCRDCVRVHIRNGEWNERPYCEACITAGVLLDSLCF